MLFDKVETLQAPKAIGPYSQALIIPPGKHLVFVSGQLPIDLQTGEIAKGDINFLTNLVIDHIEAILRSCNSHLELVIRTDVFLINLKRDFGALNAAYGKRFTSTTPPARQTIEVSHLPKDSPLEISCIAVIGE